MPHGRPRRLPASAHHISAGPVDRARRRARPRPDWSPVGAGCYAAWMPDADDNLLREVAERLIEACDVRDVDPATLTRQTPLFGAESPLGLDSLDSLEIVHMLQTRYGVRIDDQNTARQVLADMGTLCDCVAAQSQGP